MLDGLRQAGSMKVLFPRSSGDELLAVLINTAGGITGGDRFSVNAHAPVGTILTVTTQAAERAYRAQTGEVGQLKTRLSAQAGAQINWLPQETILFQGCALRRSLRIDLQDDARLLMAEPLIFGRAAMGERLTDASFRDRIEVVRNGEYLFLDAMSLSGDIDAHLAKPTIGRGNGAMVGVLYVAPDADAQVSKVRDLLPESAGASLIRDSVLFVRALAADGYELRQTLQPLLRHLKRTDLPRPWMI